MRGGRTGAAEARRAASICLILLLVATACSVDPTGEPPAARESGDSSSRAPSAASLTFELDGEASGQASVTLADGGTVRASASDGTTFELSVPPMAVAADTEITVTPMTGVEGIGDGVVHAVQLEPEGLVFNELVRLTIVPATPIAIGDQLMFEAAGDGSDSGLALIDPRSEPIVILLEHFSIAGATSVTSEQRAAFLEKSASNAERRIGNGIRELLGAERTRQLQGGSDGPEDLAALAEALEPLLDEFEREVIERRREAGSLSCDSLRAYVITVISFERTRTLLGLNDSTEEMNGRISEAVSSMTARYRECEQEAITACQDAKDAAILVDFWLAIGRQFGLAVGDAAELRARAEETCEPKGYQFEFSGSDTGEWQGFAVPVTWQLWGLHCDGDATGEWRVWEMHDVEGVGAERTQLPEQDPEGQMRVTFGDDGTIANATLITAQGDFLAPRPTLTLGGTDLVLSPPDKPVEVTAVIAAGTATITVTEPVVPADGTIAPCPPPD